MTPDQLIAAAGNGLVQAFGGLVAFTAVYCFFMLWLKLREDKRQQRMDNKLTRIQGMLIVLTNNQRHKEVHDAEQEAADE